MGTESSPVSRHSSDSFVESWTTDGPNGEIMITAHNPHETADLEQSPLVIIPGYTNGREAMASLAKRAANIGFQAVTFSYERHTKPDYDPITHKVLTAEAVALSAMEHFKKKSVQLKGFSYGGNGAVELANRVREEKSAVNIDKVSLDAPLGIVQGSRMDALIRGSQEISRLMSPLNFRRIGERALICANSLRYIAENPRLTLEEFTAAQKVNTFEKIAELHKNGLAIGVLGLSHDKLFPADELEAQLQEPPLYGSLPYKAIAGSHVDYLTEESIQLSALKFHNELGQSASSSVA